jgi:hypothetical protein
VFGKKRCLRRTQAGQTDCDIERHSGWVEEVGPGVSGLTKELEEHSTQGMPVWLFEQSFDNTAEHFYIYVGPMGARAAAAVMLGQLLIRVALSRALVEEARQWQRIKEQEIRRNWNANALRHVA